MRTNFGKHHSYGRCYGLASWKTGFFSEPWPYLLKADTVISFLKIAWRRASPARFSASVFHGTLPGQKPTAAFKM
ncbi:hypothetical protein ACUN24_20270 [Pedobacter sp. WC2501]|uniref:hypothetical protein n=1 Tax=Pedobacter sp. WC2501 TaxID=3461400 RepID=UPI00404641D2